MAKCEAVRILGKVRYDPVYVFATSKINPLPYQLEDFLTLLDMLDVGDVRVLLAYETGLGKTIVSGLFIREVLLKKPESRVLIVVPPAATNQWKIEMKEKFGLSFSDYTGVDDLSKQLLIASVDTLKRRIKELEERGTKWDVVVADELHRATPGNQRYDLLDLLSKRTAHLLALTATPHDGKEENFIGRLQLILPSVDEKNYRRFLEERSFRRRKSEVTDLEGNRLFPYPVSVETVKLEASPEEEEFYSAVEDYVRTVYGKVEERNSPLGLVATILGRMASSSVAAGLAALRRRREKLVTSAAAADVTSLLKKLREAEENEEELDQIYQEIIEGVLPKKKDLVEEELRAIERIIRLAEKVKVDSKLDALERILKVHVERGEKIVVFTSFVDTAEHIYGELSKRLGGGVYLATGRVERDEIRQNIAKFIEEGRVLVGTEVIGESLNLQAANVVVNYELPWSPIPYIQRIGRVYRYPQKKQIFVHNFSSSLRVERRMLDVIYGKVQRLVEDFDEGSVSVIGNVVSEEDVERAIYEAYTRGEEEAKRGLSEKLEDAERNLEIVNQALSYSKAAARHVDASKLLKDPAELVTERDLKRFLDYAKYAGIGRGEPNSNPIYYWVGYTPVKGLMVEDEGVKAALNQAEKLSEEYAAALWDGETTEACIVELEFRDGSGNTVYTQPALFTPKGYIDYRVLDRVKPLPLSVRVSLTPQLSADQYLEMRREEIEERLMYAANRKLELVDRQLELVDRQLEAQRDTTFLDREREMLLRKKDQLALASSDVKVSLGRTLGYLKLISPRESGEAEYDPELIRKKKEVERAAMEYVMKYEQGRGWAPRDVHEEDLGYDIESTREEEKIQIEVKGLSRESDEVTLTHNELKASEFFGGTYHLYVVIDPLGPNPRLVIQRPPLRVRGEVVVKQYIVEVVTAGG